MIHTIKQSIHTVRNSWTWNHKMLIVTLSLLAAHIAPFVPLPQATAEQVTYTRPPVIDTSIEMKLQERAHELYKQNESMDLERYRLEAIRELNNSLLDMMDESPFVDYQELKDTYGY